MNITIIGDSHCSTVVGGGNSTWADYVAKQDNLALPGSTSGHWLGLYPYHNQHPLEWGVVEYDNVWEDYFLPNLPYQTDAVIIAVGGNDMWLETDHYLGRVEELRTRLEEREHIPKVYTLQPINQVTFGTYAYPTHWGPFPLEAVRCNNNQIREEARVSIPNLIPTPLLLPHHFGPPDGDHLHMTRAGHGVIYRAVSKALESNT